MTVVPAITVAAAIAISEYFFFKVFPLCRSGDGAFLPVVPVAEILGVGILFRIVFARFLLRVLRPSKRKSPTCYEDVIKVERVGRNEDHKCRGRT
jgi:hypothetical protein